MCRLLVTGCIDPADTSRKDWPGDMKVYEMGWELNDTDGGFSFQKRVVFGMMNAE